MNTIFNALWSGARGNRTPSIEGGNPDVGTIQNSPLESTPKSIKYFFKKQEASKIKDNWTLELDDSKLWNQDYHLKPGYRNFDHPSIASYAQ